MKTGKTLSKDVGQPFQWGSFSRYDLDNCFLSVLNKGTTEHRNVPDSQNAVSA